MKTTITITIDECDRGDDGSISAAAAKGGAAFWEDRIAKAFPLISMSTIHVEVFPPQCGRCASSSAIIFDRDSDTGAQVGLCGDCHDEIERGRLLAARPRATRFLSPLAASFEAAIRLILNSGEARDVNDVLSYFAPADRGAAGASLVILASRGVLITERHTDDADTYKRGPKW